MSSEEAEIHPEEESQRLIIAVQMRTQIHDDAAQDCDRTHRGHPAQPLSGALPAATSP